MKVSVIIPTYNAGKFINRTLQSVIKCRTYSDVEIIVIDDYSTDATVEICKQYPVNIYVNGSNSGGPNEGRNKGLKLAQGDYVCFLDHDDEITTPERFISQLRNIHALGIDIAICSYQNIHANGKTQTITARGSHDFLYKKNEAYELFISHDKNGIKLIPGCALIKKSACPEFTGKMSDYKWLSDLLKNRVIYVSNAVMINRYLHGMNLSSDVKYKHETFDDQVSMMNKAKGKEKRLFMRGYRNLCGIMARRYFHMQAFNTAREYLIGSQITYKNIVLFVASYFPALREYINKNKNILGI